MQPGDAVKAVVSAGRLYQRYALEPEDDGERGR